MKSYSHKTYWKLHRLSIVCSCYNKKSNTSEQNAMLFCTKTKFSQLLMVDFCGFLFIHLGIESHRNLLLRLHLSQQSLPAICQVIRQAHLQHTRTH